MTTTNKHPERVNIKTEHHELYTLTSWTDTRITGETPDERMRQYQAREDERRAEYYEEGILGQRCYASGKNRVVEYSFGDVEQYRAWLHMTMTPDRYIEFIRETSDKEITEYDTLEVGFPSLDVGKIDLRNPDNKEWLDMAVDLMVDMRCGNISPLIARILATTVEANRKPAPKLTREQRKAAKRMKRKMEKQARTIAS